MGRIITAFKSSDIFLAAIVFTAVTVSAAYMAVQPLQEKFRSDAENILVKTAEHSSLLVADFINYPIFFVRDNAANLALYIGRDIINREEFATHMTKLLEGSPYISSAWYMFEPDAFDRDGERYIGTPHGDIYDGSHMQGLLIREGNGSIAHVNLSDPESLFDQIYLRALEMKRLYLTVPYREVITAGTPLDTISVIEPIISPGGEWLGVLGVDIYLDFIHTFMSDIEIFDTGYLMLIDCNGTILHSPDPNEWMMNKQEITFNYHDFPETGTFDTVVSNINGKRNLVYTVPINFELDDYTYYLSVVVPLSELYFDANRIILLFTIGVGIILLLFATLLYYLSWSRKRIEKEGQYREELLSNLNHMKTEFFQNMSHDLKTPLTIISTDIENAADYLEYDMNKEGMRASLAHAQEEIMRMARLINSTLKYAAAHKTSDSPEPLEPASFLRKTGELFRAAMERNGNRLTLDIPLTMPHMLCVEDTLFQVLSNLLTNANRHTQNGDIYLKAAVENKMVLVTISDTDTSDTAEFLSPKIKRGAPGTGMGKEPGLSVIKTTIEKMGGTFKVKIIENKGTAITFTVPVYEYMLD